MATVITPPTRQQLESFLPDNRSVRAFEKLFTDVPSYINEVTIISGEADTRSKSNGVLLWLSM